MSGAEATRHPPRVLEVGEGLSGAYAGLILAAIGWDVCQVVLPSRRLNDAEVAFYDRGRTAVVPTAGTVGRLADVADLVLTDVAVSVLPALGLAIDEDDLQRRRPGTVQVSVTPFGLWGPHAGYATSEITEWAAGGLAYATRRPVARDEVEGYTPVLPPGRQSEVLGGIAAAIGALAGFRLARASGRSVMVDVSRQEVLASMAHHHFPILLYDQMVVGDPTHRLLYGYLLPTADGDVYLRTVEPAQWDRLAEWMGNPEWAQRRDANELPIYYSAPEIVGPLLSEWTTSFTRAELLAGALARRLPISVPRELDEVLEWDQLAATGSLALVDQNGEPRTAPRVPVVEHGAIGPSVTGTAADVEAAWRARSCGTTR